VNGEKKNKKKLARLSRLKFKHNSKLKSKLARLDKLKQRSKQRFNNNLRSYKHKFRPYRHKCRHYKHRQRLPRTKATYIPKLLIELVLLRLHFLFTRTRVKRAILSLGGR